VERTWVVEIVSDSSEQEDVRRLPAAYFRAGVRECCWTPRGPEMRFEIHRRGPDSFESTSRDSDGYQASEVLSARVRLERTRHARGHWNYRMA
jgi:hypothetical protein